jgi:hypothetical protein
VLILYRYQLWRWECAEAPGYVRQVEQEASPCVSIQIKRRMRLERLTLENITGRVCIAG